MTSQKQMTIREFTVEIIDQNDSYEKLDSFDFNASQLLISEGEEIGSVVGRFLLPMNMHFWMLNINLTTRILYLL